MTTWALPSSVWVAVMTMTTEVHVRDLPATGQLSGGMAALFAPVRAEARTTARVVACCASKGQVEAALEDWRQANPGSSGEVSVQEVPFGRVKHRTISGIQSTCIGCGKEIDLGFRCDPCQKAYFAQVRAADTGEFAEEAS